MSVAYCEFLMLGWRSIVGKENAKMIRLRHNQRRNCDTCQNFSEANRQRQREYILLKSGCVACDLCTLMNRIRDVLNLQI